MMRKIKKIMSAVIALILSLVFVMPAFAAANDGSITIHNAQPGKTYQAYRLFDLNLAGSNYGYTVNDQWKEFFTNDAGKNMIHIDEANGNVTLADESAAGVQALAQEAQKYAAANVGQVTAYQPTGTAPALTFSNLPLGYYLVTTDAGALQALDTTNKDAVMFEKNTAPAIGKSADKTNAAYGDTVHYEVPFTRGGYVWGDYVITDIMTGLDLKQETVKIQVNQQDIAKASYTINYTENNPEAGSNTLKVTVSADVLNQYNPGTEFVLVYDAVAKKTVSMDNTVQMDYMTKPGIATPDGQTPSYEVKVANYEFIVEKTDGNTQLSGATFELHGREDCSDAAIEFVKTGDTYRLAEAGETNPAKTSTITAGKATIEGLAAGTYYLKEIAAPDGYNKLVNPVKIVITENLNDKTQRPFDDNGNRLDPTITVNDTTNATAGVVTVVNKTGAELPSTGGVGTTVFYVVGAVLILAAVVILVVKKRMAR